MTGGVTWEQLTVLASVVVFVVSTMGGIFVWVVNRQQKMHEANLVHQRTTIEEQQRLRHDLRASVEQRMTVLDQRITDESRRIDQVEIFNAGLRIVMANVDEFKKETKEDFRALSAKLDQLISDQIRPHSKRGEAKT